VDIITAYNLPSQAQITALSFVIRLESERSEDEARKLVHEYVLTPAVTEELPKIFKYLREVWSRGEELGWFVHGSFGSGKSHFMSFLGMLLEDVEVAWKKPSAAVQELEREHRAWLRQGKPLVVRIHMLSAQGNSDFDRAVYEGFNAALKRQGKPVFEYLHIEGILDEMRKEAEQYGDVFWHHLEQQGILGSKEDFEAQARGEPEDREALVRAYLEFKKRDAASAGINPNWAEGLQRMMRHAKAQGFGGVVFFVDELLLWLSEKRAEEFKRAINQLNTMVDHADGRRTLPLCVFVARQRNIKEFFPHLAHEDELHQHLDHHAKRFNLTTLGDVELRHICKERVLQPRHPEEVAKAVKEAADKHKKLLPTLLQSADEAYLRDVYPFHPALIEMLIDISALMQRERTALKLLYELLVVHYPHLPLGKFLPVGSAFEAIFPESGVEGNQRQNDLKAIQKLYYVRFRPAMQMLRQQTADAPEEGDRFGEVAQKLLDQLIKTVLLAEVSPRLKGSRGMTIERLVQLNDVDVPGTLDRARGEMARKWLVQLSRLVPDLQIAGSDKSATVSVVLQGVNFGEILERARGKVQNEHARFRTFCRVLAEMLGVAKPEDLIKTRTLESYKVEWRRTPRKGSVALLNVREQTAQGFRPREGEEWRLLIDYPWDTDNHTVDDDVRRAQEIRSKEGTFHTYCWLPHHFTPSEEHALVELAAAVYINTPEGQSELLGNLGQHEKQQAIEQALSYGTTWKTKVREILQKVYSEEARIISMRDKADATLLDRNDMKTSVERLALDILDNRYPNHPSFGMTPTQLDLGLLKQWLTEAFQASDNRVGFDDETLKVLTNLGKPLELVDIGQSKARFLLEGRYLKAVLQAAGGGSSWGPIDQMLEEQFGFQPAVRNFFLVILCQCYGYRALNGRDPVEVKIENKPYGSLTLQLGKLLDPAEWSSLRTAAQEAFGVEIPARRTLNDQDTAATAVGKEARQRHQSLQNLHLKLVELTKEEALPRLALIKEAMINLAPLLIGGDSHALLDKFLSTWGTGSATWKELGQKAASFLLVLGNINETVLGQLRKLQQGTSPLKMQAGAHLDALSTLLGRSDGTPPTELELKEWSRDAKAIVDSLIDFTPPPPPPQPPQSPQPPQPPPPPPAEKGEKLLLEKVGVDPKNGDGLVEFWGKLKKELMALPPGEIEITVQIRPKKGAE